MKDKVVELSGKYKLHLLLILIFLLGAYLRTYHFNDFLHFELDQSRDAKVIDLAIDEGIGNLPLQGPKAAGSFLRLGPIFYYFQYLSALIFGDTPPGMVAISFFFSCLTIPLIYFFLRRYLKSNVSLLLTLFFSTSLFFIMYSRFGWNPNNLPFFVLLSLFGLLKATDSEEKRKGLWLLVAAIGLSVSTQLHFLAFMAVPVISAAYLLIKRPKISVRYWLGALLIIFIFYLPPIVNDLKTGGDNIKEFQKALTKKSTDEHTLIEKAVRDYTDNSLGYFLLVTSREKAELPKLRQLSGTSFDILCDQDCRNNLPWGALALFFMSSGILLLLFRNYQEFKKKSSARKDFLMLNLIWLIVASGLFFPIAYDIAPRFFLLVSGLPFVFLGLIFELLMEKTGKRMAWIIIIGLSFLILLSDGLSIGKRFWEMQNAPYKSFDIDPDRILKERTRVTLEQQYLITDYIESIYEENGFPVYVNSDAYFRRSFLYHLEKIEIPRDDFRNIKTIYRQGNYFLIYPTLSNLESKTEKYMEDFDIVETKEFGTMVAFRLIPRPDSINAERQEFEPEGKPKSAPGVPTRYRWEEIFNDSSDDEEAES